MSRRQEQLLFRYSSALERGDFQTVVEVLRDAERDAALEQMILDVNDAYTAELSVNSNHKKQQEVPMLAAIYQTPSKKRPQLHGHSLPLIAALAVIGLLVAMLAVQGRVSLSTGQGSTPLAVAQNSTFCQATTLAPVNVVTLPGTAGVILGTIPAGQVVTVQIRQVFSNNFGSTVWYFVTTPTMQGWITIEALDAKNCGDTAPPTNASTPTLVPNTSGQATPYPTALAQSSIEACTASTRAKIDLMSSPLWNGIVTGSLPNNTVVTVFDYNVLVDSQHNEILWYYVKSRDIQGWTPTYLLDASNCASIPVMQVAQVATPTPVSISLNAYQQAQTATSQAALLATATEMIRQATQSADTLATTPTPAPANIIVTAQAVTMTPTAYGADCQVSIRDVTQLVKLYARPGYADEVFSSTGIDPYTVTWIESTTAGGSVWQHVRIDVAGVGRQEGWMTDQQFHDRVTCALINRGELPTALPMNVTAPANDQAANALPPTVVPPENDTAGIAQHPFFVVTPPSPIELTAIVATLNATYQPMPTLISAQNSDQTTICSTPATGDSQAMTLYAQPVSDAPIVGIFYTVDTAQSHISVLQAVYVAGQTWYYIEIGSYPNQPRGWVSKEHFDAVMGSCNITYVQPLNTPTLTPISAVTNTDQQSSVPTVKCPAPDSVPPRIMMYSRPSLDSFKFSQDYYAAQYSFFLLDSTDVGDQTWYYIQIDTSISQKQGWITWDQYNILKDCAPMNAIAQTTAIPSDGTLPPVPTVVPTVISPYTVYLVQPGDTLLSILGRFNLGADALPKIAFINHLSENAVLDVGTSLLIPTPTNAQPLTCVVTSKQTVELRAFPSTDAPVLLTLPAGTVFQINDRNPLADQTWYTVTAQINQTTISNVWVQMDAPLDCQRFAPDGAASGVPADGTAEALSPTPTIVR